MAATWNSFDGLTEAKQRLDGEKKRKKELLCRSSGNQRVRHYKTLKFELRRASVVRDTKDNRQEINCKIREKK